MAMAFSRIGRVLRGWSKGGRGRVADRKAAVRRAVAEVLEDRRLLTATLQVDVRLAAGQTSVVDHVGQVVNLEVWAKVMGSNGTGADDGLAWVGGNILSKGSGILGDLQATLVSPFNVFPSTTGARADLDGDGAAGASDLDIGTNSTSAKDAGSFFSAWASDVVAGQATTGAQEFEVATLTFTATKLNSLGSTDIVFNVAKLTDSISPVGAEWRVDGVNKQSYANVDEIGTGAGVYLTSPDTAPPQAVVSNASKILTSGGGATLTINVIYTDQTKVLRSFGHDNIVVTGPRGTYTGYYAAVSESLNAPTIVVGYRLNTRAGYWNAMDNGTYTVVLKANQVKDTLGNVAATDTTIGTFQVNIPQAVVTRVYNDTPMLAVKGTTGHDQIYLTKSGSQIAVAVNGVTQSFDAASVNSINIDALAGNDFISIGAGVPAVWADGGDGHDTILGGDGNDTLYGSGGNDIIVGGGGNDAINGGTGRNILIGGKGGDALDASLGEDILVAGSTSYDANPIALHAIQAEWVGAHLYWQRVYNIRTGNGSSGRANGTYYLTPNKTVFADSAADLLRGGKNLDWFLYTKSGTSKDTVQNLLTTEYADDLSVVK